MQLCCERCEKAIDYSGDRPLYCPYCGAPLPHVAIDPNLTRTHPPSTASARSGGGGTISQAVADGTPGETSLPSTIAPDGLVDLAAISGTAPLERVGAYRIVRRIGVGGMGAVYEAEDELTTKRVAVKVVKPQTVITPGGLERFRQEGRLASLISHPRCVFVLKAEEESGRPYIVMELMPGATLKDLVRQQGPLAPAVAVAKIMDVLDGLIEAHSLGVLHRDVKPSNCFLMTDGRVKIGDFGLSKLVAPDAEASELSRMGAIGNDGGDDKQKAGLTRTGAFLGTPLFASPEQIRGEPIDFRCDVYSAAATLYFLLTGRAPFEGGDPSAVVARIVSDPVPPIRKKQPRVPPGLERAVLKGLERQRERRWQSLEEFRDALVAYLPTQSTMATRTARFRAFIMDGLILLPLLLFIVQMVRLAVNLPAWEGIGQLFIDLPLAACVMLYFGLLEALTGATLGKRLLRLRVRMEKTYQQPRKRQILLRVLVFFGLILLPGRIAYYVSPFPWLGYALNVAGLLVILDTMRRGNGYRGLHDLLSKTQVVQLPWPKPRPNLAAREEVELRPLPPGWPDAIGPYLVKGVVQANQAEILVAGDDPILERPVWLSVQPQASPSISSVRREITRPTRLRWLASGTASLATEHLPAALSAKLQVRPTRRSGHPRQATSLSRSGANALTTVSEASSARPMLWDAFLAGEGSPLPELLVRHGRLEWVDARFILEQLSDELIAAAHDGTLPQGLEPGHIWVQGNGRILLIGPTETGAAVDAASEEARALRFLGDIAIFLLEGKSRPPGAPLSPIQARVPDHARPLVNRLIGLDGGYASLREVKQVLQQTQGMPAALTTPQRFSLLWVVGTFLAPFLLAMFLVGRYYYEILPTVKLNLQIQRAERAVKLLDDPAAYTSVFAGANLTEWLRLVRRGPLNFVVGPNFFILPRDQREVLLARLMRQQIVDKLNEDRAKYSVKFRMMALAFAPELLAPLLAKKVDHGADLSPTEQLRQERLHDLRLALHHAHGHDRPDSRDDPENAPLLTMNPLYLAWGAICVWPVLWILVAAATGGGIAIRLLGLQLVRADGRPAQPWQAALRATIIWLPIVLLLGISVALQNALPGHEVLHWVVWWLAVFVLALYGVNMLLGVGRALSDRIARVYLLPK